MAYLEPQDILWIELARLATDEGLALYDVERLSDSGLRVVISKPPVPEAAQEVTELAADFGRHVMGGAGVKSEDCSRFCRKLMVHFSVEGPRFGLITEPQIEVSSPGINRTLRLQEHFAGAVGERIKLIPRGEQSERNAKQAGPIVGTLEQCKQSELTIAKEDSAEKLIVLIDDVKRAQVDFRF